YQILVPHRHWLSHSWLLGPLLRALYFFLILYVLLRLGIVAVDRWIVPIDQSQILQALQQELRLTLQSHVTWAQSALIGLIAGGVVHSLTDAFVSWFKRSL
ncbi:MAG: metal-binding protein, partial [Armatimonadetes bacterium]|nr:metal-binding protein [Armatimonadota bacterium]